MGLMCLVLTLTNCQKAQIEEVNPSPEANFELFASPAVATDAAITRTTNGGLATKWATGDQINIFHAPAGSTTYTNDKAFTLKDAATGSFGGTVGALDGGSYDWYAFYPYKDKIVSPKNEKTGYCYIGSRSDATQSQSGDNNMSHISGGNYPLYGIAKNVASSDVPSIQMQHLSSVVKIVVTNSTDEALALTDVAFTANENISGQFYISFDSETPKYTDAQYPSKTAKLAVSDVTISPKTSATVYFAVKPFTATAGSTLKLAVNGYEKTLTLKNDITFTAGHIKPLNFNFDKKTENYNGDYVLVTLCNNSYWYMSTDVAGTTNTTKNQLKAVDSKVNKITDYNTNADFSNIDEKFVWTLEKVGSYYLLKNYSTGKYLTGADAKNNYAKLTSSVSDAEKLSVTKSDNKYKLVSQSVSTKSLGRNSSSNNTVYAFYKEAIQDIYLIPYISLPSLATPKVQAEVQDVNSVYALWGKIAGAKDYTVTCGEQTFTTADTKYTFTNLAYSTEYTVSVVANPSDETVNAPSAAGKSEVVKTGANPSETVVETKIDFEAELTTFVDWSFTNIAKNNTITAKAGSYYGKTNGTTSAYAATKGIIAKPKNVSFSISKETKNTTSSNWKVQVSTNNKDWTDVKSVSATDMSKGVWKDYSVDLASYKDVYVRIYYTGTTAIRCIDEVVLSYVK